MPLTLQLLLLLRAKGYENGPVETGMALPCTQHITSLLAAVRASSTEEIPHRVPEITQGPILLHLMHFSCTTGDICIVLDASMYRQLNQRSSQEAIWLQGGPPTTVPFWQMKTRDFPSSLRPVAAPAPAQCQTHDFMLLTCSSVC